MKDKIRKVFSKSKRCAQVITHSMPAVNGREEKNLCIVLKSRFLSEGEEVAKFESEMADYIGTKFALATNSGTAALHCALLALGIGENDEVIIPNYVCRSVLNAVQYVRAKPVLCDVDRRTFNIKADEVRSKINSRTRLIIVAHMFGCPAEIREIKKMHIPVIEDCAQSIGAEYDGQKVGNFGDIAVFSFEGTKPITTGEGGMVLTSSPRLYKRLINLKEPYKRNQSPKYTYRMSCLQAAVGRVQLKKLPEFIRKRRRISEKYIKAFNSSGIDLPVVPKRTLHIFHRFIITLKRKSLTSFIELTQRKGVLVKRPIRPFTINEYLGISGRLFPETQFIMKHCASVPIYPSLDNQQIKYIIKSVEDSYLAAGER